MGPLPQEENVPWGAGDGWVAAGRGLPWAGGLAASSLLVSPAFPLLGSSAAALAHVGFCYRRSRMLWGSSKQALCSGSPGGEELP